MFKIVILTNYIIIYFCNVNHFDFLNLFHLVGENLWVINKLGIYKFLFFYKYNHIFGFGNIN